MKAKTDSIVLMSIRAISAGVLLSMVIFYCLHFFGKWESEDYRPDAETTSKLLVRNQCTLLGKTHILWPTDTSRTEESISEIKFTGSFMNFIDGHVPAMVLFALVIGGIIMLIRTIAKKKKHTSQSAL